MNRPQSEGTDSLQHVLLLLFFSPTTHGAPELGALNTWPPRVQSPPPSSWPLDRPAWSPGSIVVPPQRHRGPGRLRDPQPSLQQAPSPMALHFSPRGGGRRVPAPLHAPQHRRPTCQGATGARQTPARQTSLPAALPPWPRPSPGGCQRLIMLPGEGLSVLRPF